LSWEIRPLLRALEAACIARFGTLRPDGETPVLRSDHGLIFQSRRCRAACKDSCSARYWRGLR
jgi:hypothetical protein